MTESSETGGREAEIRAACLRISEHFMTTGATSLPAPVSPPGRRRPSRLPARLTAIAEPIGGAPLFTRSACHSVARPSRPLRCVAPSDSGTPRQALHAGAVGPFRRGVRYSLTGRTCGLHDSRGTVPSPPGSSFGASTPALGALFTPSETACANIRSVATASSSPL
jgi:hypothetical protein